MVRIPSDRPPTHPGIMLREEFLDPLGITQRELADAICIPYQRVNEIVNEKRGITPSTALRLAKFFGNSPGFWMNLQLHYDLFEAKLQEDK
jgi:addiction module HigA family antidote